MRIRRLLSLVPLVTICGFTNYVGAQQVGVPIIDPEPEFSPGHVNFISWAQVPQADAYMVQASSSPQFYSPISSGWTTSTSHLFSGLSDGVKYYYRVQVRQADSGTTQTWSGFKETSTDKMELDDLIIQAPSNNVVLTDRVLDNMSFENANLDWAITINDPNGSMYCEVQDYAQTPMPTHGSKHLAIGLRNGISHRAGEFRSVRQLMNLGVYNTLTFDLLVKTRDSSIDTSVLIDNVRVFHTATAGDYRNQSIDISALKGVHTLELRNYVNNMITLGGAAYFDNIRLSPASPITTGSIVSALINPAPFHSWGTLNYNISTSVGTGIRFDILPATGDDPVPGYANLPNGVDLSSLQEFPIRLRATFTSDNPAITPSMSSWSVRYLDGYSFGNYSSVVSSTQDATSPTLIPIAVTPNPTKTVVGPLTLTFSEPIINFDLSDVELTRDAGQNLITGEESLVSSDQRNWTLNISSRTSTDGLYALSIPGKGITDRAGNTLTSGISTTWVSDFTSPSVTIHQNLDSNALNSIPINITFSEAVHGFTARDVITTNSRVIGLVGNTSSTVYSCLLYPIAAGPFEVHVPANVCTDQSGNLNSVSNLVQGNFSGAPVFPPIIDIGQSDTDWIMNGYDRQYEFFGSGDMIATGDFNGDKITDLLVGAEGNDGLNGLRWGAGAAYVFFGNDIQRQIRDVEGIAGRSPDIIIYGAGSGDGVGVIGSLLAGDITGDGIDEMIIGAYMNDGINGEDSGAGYIIFGSPSLPSVIDLRDPPVGIVTTIHGSEYYNCTWRSGARLVGDLNDDGFIDFATGSPLEASYSGRVYIVFGRATGWSSTINLAVSQPGICRIVGPPGNRDSGWLGNAGAMTAGDFNGDGIDDLGLGATFGAGPSGSGRTKCGRVYLIKGKSDWPLDINLSAPGSADMTVYGAYSGQSVGSSRNAIQFCDLDDDEFEDLIVSHFAVDAGSPPGSVYIVYGKSSPSLEVDFAAGQADAVIDGVDSLDVTRINGTNPSMDLNGDSYLDLVITAEFADGPANQQPAVGEAYIIFGDGGRLPAYVNLASPPEAVKSCHIIGPATNSGMFHLATENLNDDSIPDLVFGTKSSSITSVEVLFGRHSWPAEYNLGNTPSDFRVIGKSIISFADAADINGDGANDLLISSPNSSGFYGTPTFVGSVYAVLGIVQASPPTSVREWMMY